VSDGLEDENASAAFKKVQGFFLQLKRLGVASLLVHHANKSGREMRGSTALETTFEVILGLTKPNIARMGEARFVAEFSKFRGKGDVRLQKREWKLTETGWDVSEDLPDDPRLDPVYLALKSHRFTSANQIGNELGMHRSTVLRRIERLVILGVLKKDEQHEFFSKARDLAKSNAENGWDEHYPDVAATALVDETF